MAVKGGTLFILSLEAAYLKAAIESGKNERAKRALQTICKIYWNGACLLPQELNGFENTVLGALSSGNADEKVRRWSLSALSQFGRKVSCWDSEISTLQRHQNEPQVVSAAIAAAFKLSPATALRDLSKLAFISPDILILSAMQSVSEERLLGALPKIDVETASVTALKLSLILVGLDKAPENLFHPRFGNHDLVRELGGHEDSLVSQYSIWATAENPKLSAKDLGIDARSVEGRGSGHGYRHIRHPHRRIYPQQRWRQPCIAGVARPDPGRRRDRLGDRGRRL